ncbi:hypothetical protein [Spectribacter hydrogenoxidans]|uniref:Phage DNA packaging protein, Nu1 subunit of terminase n=1 Tax=Spectribacter hydrogenoxidans TaxID=3075608 RepID=A0ABU3C0M1_9GAMM|nr:hypothetical protein [Salinisphaera sp. W335]MDT0635078.1 hypothetical protein [Salinisphaera sp. W335]
MADGLVTARKLVEALASRGLGEWSADAVRQWVREEPPCPIAKAGGRGQAHRYDVEQVASWLRARDGKEKVKGYTPPPDSSAPAQRQQPAGQGQQGGGINPALMRDPRNHKAFHEARLAKLRADEMEQRLIPAEELESAMRQLVLSVRSSLLALPSKTARVLDDCETFEERRAVIEREVYQVLTTLAEAGAMEKNNEAA